MMPTPVGSLALKIVSWEPVGVIPKAQIQVKSFSTESEWEQYKAWIESIEMNTTKIGTSKVRTQVLYLPYLTSPVYTIYI